MPHNLVFSLQGNIGGQICVFNHQSGSGHQILPLVTVVQFNTILDYLNI